MSENKTPVKPAMYSETEVVISGSISAVGPWGPVYTSYFGPTVTFSSCGRPMGPITPITYAKPEGSLPEKAPVADSQ